MKAFIDTNIFIYAQDEGDTEKAQKARELLLKLRKTHTGFVSTQVIQEFCNVALKKSATPLKPSDVSEIIDELLLPILAHTPDGAFYKRALKTYERYSLSYYDSTIVQAAIDLNCNLLYSEDMQNGVHYSGVTVVNPLI